MSPRFFLLNTRIFLEALLNPDQLPVVIQIELMNPNNTIWFSGASICEIAIKSSLCRDDFSFNSIEIHQLALENSFTELPNNTTHL